MSALSWILGALHFLLAPLAAGHALLYKRDPRSAWGWICVCLLFPLAGPVLYFIFGINRIRGRAQKLQWPSPAPPPAGSEEKAESVEADLPREFSALAPIAAAVTGRRPTGGNRVEILRGGEEAFTKMLEAIEVASRSVCLLTYIFETNRTGRRFVDTLAAAAGRGVEVRVIIDGMGELYSFPRAGKLLLRRGVRVARFLPPRLIPPTFMLNLRNHRKILVTDGDRGYTGGMNIGDSYVTTAPDGMRDLHFEMTGPVVGELEQAFDESWEFITGEAQPRQEGGPDAGADGAFCRTILDGPDENLEKLTAVLIGVVSAARARVLVMTPYFLPSRELVAAFQAAVLRGVEVVVVLPEKNNLPFIHWATRNMLWELLQRGVRIFYQPPPFAHTKLLVVDDCYSLVGSANLDPRSLRLNFELVVEIFDRRISSQLAAHIEKAELSSREVTLQEVDGRPLPERLRDSFCWLFSPYL